MTVLEWIQNVEQEVAAEVISSVVILGLGSLWCWLFHKHHKEDRKVSREIADRQTVLLEQLVENTKPKGGDQSDD